MARDVRGTGARIEAGNEETLALSNMKSGSCADPALFGRSVIPTISLDKNLPAGDGGPSEVVRIAHVTSGLTGYALGPIVMTFSALAYDQTEPSWIYGGGDLWLYDWTDLWGASVGTRL